ncbi:MAG: gluconeogenesis factor YvcK family protein [Sphingomonadaceae bacterium]
MSFLKWLYPGMRIKRWLILLTVGLVLVSLGLAYVLVHIYRTQPFPDYVASLTLQFIDRPVRGALFISAGITVLIVAFWRLNESVLSAVMPNGRSSNLVDIVYNHRHRQRGPKIVAIGGGTGLSTLLRGLKEYTTNITAIVTVADDGGSSGRLRRELGVLPPGDFRNCIVALADAEPLMTKLFQYRFSEGSGLDGHSFGNLFIVAMSGITGNFERAIRESSRVLAVRGQILPSTLENVTLCAELLDEARVEGESNISKSSEPIKRVYLQPEHPAAYPEAIRAILDADLVVIGPGSLYTSVLPNLLVEDLARALISSKALKVYVCNVATQRGETDNFMVQDHVRALLHHLPENPLHFVLANDKLGAELPAHWRVSQVAFVGEGSIDGAEVVQADVIDPQNPLRHDSKKLAQALMRLYYDKAEVALQRPNGEARHSEADVRVESA